MCCVLKRKERLIPCTAVAVNHILFIYWCIGNDAHTIYVSTCAEQVQLVASCVISDWCFMEVDLCVSGTTNSLVHLYRAPLGTRWPQHLILSPNPHLRNLTVRSAVHNLNK